MVSTRTARAAGPGSTSPNTRECEYGDQLWVSQWKKGLERQARLDRLSQPHDDSGSTDPEKNMTRFMASEINSAA